MSMPVDKIIENDLQNPEQTLAESGFHWRESDGVRVLVCSRLQNLGFVNGFSTRVGGVSPFPENALNLAGFDEDTAENIYENRRRFLNVIGSDLKLATVWQVHGDVVKVATTPEEAESSETRADAIASDLRGIVAGVKTADCVPILIADPRTGAYAAVHAGWRGTVQSIATKAVDTLRSRFNANSADLVCAIGPAAGCERYEVGQDVIDGFAAFEDSDSYFKPTRPGHALIDLHRANRDQLISAGVSPDNIYIAPFCTIERTDLFFSYRIEKKVYGKTGRLMSVIGRV